MPDAGLSLSPDAMRRRALETLAALVTGSFGERMRLEAAARILVTARRVAVLAGAGELDAPPPSAGRIATLAARWDATAMTVMEFAETLDVSDIAALLEEAPHWAETVWARQQTLPEIEKARLLQRA